MRFLDSPFSLLFVCLISSMGVIVVPFVIFASIKADEKWWPIGLFGVFWLWAAISSGKRLFSTQVPVNPRVSELDGILSKGMTISDAIDAVRIRHEPVTPPRYYAHSVEIETRGVIFEIFSAEGIVTGWTAK
jgi:hypothetical protein